MNKTEKMEVMKKAVEYARGAYNCLDCIGPGGWSGGGLNCRGGNRDDVERINSALLSIGLSPKDVDVATDEADIMEHGGSLGLSHMRIRSCVDVDAFLKVVESLISPDD